MKSTSGREVGWDHEKELSEDREDVGCSKVKLLVVHGI